MKKLLLTFGIALANILGVQAQCNTLTATAANTNLQCGQSTTLSHDGRQLLRSSFNADFNNSSMAGWETSQTVTFTNNICGAQNADGSIFAWMGSSSAAPRRLVTPALNFGPLAAPAGGTICFDLRMAIQGQSSPCEGPDLSDEGVYLHYSIDNGATWVQIHYFHPNGGGSAQPTTRWNNYCFPIPQGALVNGVKFKWQQLAVSGAAYDHWGIDNVQIIVNDPTLEFVWAHDNYRTRFPGTNPTPVTPSETTTYTVWMITQDTINGVPTADTCTQTVTVNVGQKPVLTMPPDITVCNGTQVPAKVITANPTASVIRWNVDENIGMSAGAIGGNIPAFTAVNNGDTIPVTATLSATATLNGSCPSDTFYYRVTVLPTPRVTPPANIVKCHGDLVANINFTSNVQQNYTWVISDSTVGNPLRASGANFIPGFTAVNTGNTPLTSTFTVTPNVGECIGTPSSFTITVNPRPTVSGGPDQTICRNEQITLAGSGANSYNWTNNASNNVPFAPTTTNEYVVTGFNMYNCSNKDTVLVIVNQLPPVVAINDKAICKGDSTILLATGAVTYAWTSNVTNGTAVSPNQTTTYYVTGTDNNGCSNYDSTLVFVHNLPMIEAGPETTVCLGFTYTPSGAYGEVYNWSHNATNGQPMNLPLGDHWLYLIGTDANGCTNHDSVLVHVIEPPVTHFTPNAYVGYPGTVFTYTNNSANANVYSWEFGNGGTATTYNANTDVTSQYPYTGDYIVVLYADNGICKYPYQDTVHIIPFPDPEIFVPNVFTPNGDGVNDRFYLDVTWGKQIEVVILNRWGNHMATITDFNHGWDGKTPNGQDATEGVYFFKYEILGFNDKTYTGHGFVTLEK